MHLSPNLDYPWVLRLSDDELTIIQKGLRGDGLTIEEESEMDRLSGTLDMIREKAERTKRFRNNRRGRRNYAMSSDNRQQDNRYADNDEDF